MDSISQQNVTNKIKYQYKNNHVLLINSLIWAGLGFVIVGLLSIGYSALIKQQFNSILGTDGYFFGSLIVMLAFVITAFIINIKWSMNVLDSSWGLIFGAWTINILLLTGMIAPLVTLINDSQLVFIVISVSGGIFLLMGLIGYSLMKIETAFMVSKLVWIILGVMFMLQLIFMLTFAFLYSNSFSVYYLIFDMGYLLVNILMIGLTFFSIKKQSEMYNNIDKQQKMKLGLFYGMQLLIQFVIMFMYLLRIIASFRNN